MKKLVSLLALCFAACGGASVGDCPSNSDATQSAGRALIRTRCAICHSSQLSGAQRQNAPDGVNYDTAAAIKLNLDDGWSETESKSMPEGSMLTDAEIESIRVYLACGAPDIP